MEDLGLSGCTTRTPDVLCDAVEQAGKVEGYAAAEPCAVEQARDVAFNDSAAAAYGSTADTVLDQGTENLEWPQMISDTMDVAVGMDAQNEVTLVPASMPPEPMPQTAHSRGKSRSQRRHVEEESFGLTSDQFGFRDSTLWCWRCGGWSVGSRRTSRLKGPCGAPTKTEQMLCTAYLVVSLLKLTLGDLMMFLEPLSASQSSKNPYSNRYRPQVLPQVDSPA